MWPQSGIFRNLSGIHHEVVRTARVVVETSLMVKTFEKGVDEVRLSAIPTLLAERNR